MGDSSEGLQKEEELRKLLSSKRLKDKGGEQRDDKKGSSKSGGGSSHRRDRDSGSSKRDSRRDRCVVWMATVHAQALHEHGVLTASGTCLCSQVHLTREETPVLGPVPLREQQPGGRAQQL